MRSERDGNQSRSRPAEEAGHRVCEESACPSERARDVSAAEHRDSLHRERAGEEEREEYEDDPRQLSLKGGAAGLAAIALDRARVG
jgi:hypothetical protein